MNPDTWRSVRWLVALALCALVVVVSVPLAFDAVTSVVVFGEEGDAEAEQDEQDEQDGQAAPDDEAAEPPGEVPTGPVSDGEAAAEADVVVADGTVTQAPDEDLVLGEAGDGVVIEFPLVEGDPACIARAELQMAVTEAEETELAAYAGQAGADLTDGSEIGDPRRDDVVHSLALTDGTPGRLSWDVTELYRAWAAGDLAAPGSPFVVVVAPPDAPAAVTFAASESEDGPTLSWEGEDGCGE